MFGGGGTRGLAAGGTSRRRQILGEFVGLSPCLRFDDRAAEFVADQAGKGFEFGELGSPREAAGINLATDLVGELTEDGPELVRD